MPVGLVSLTEGEIIRDYTTQTRYNKLPVNCLCKLNHSYISSKYRLTKLHYSRIESNAKYSNVIALFAWLVFSTWIRFCWTFGDIFKFLSIWMFYDTLTYFAALWLASTLISMFYRCILASWFNMSCWLWLAGMWVNKSLHQFHY